MGDLTDKVCIIIYLCILKKHTFLQFTHNLSLSLALALSLYAALRALSATALCLIHRFVWFFSWHFASNFTSGVVFPHFIWQSAQIKFSVCTLNAHRLYLSIVSASLIALPVILKRLPPFCHCLSAFFLFPFFSAI